MRRPAADERGAMAVELAVLAPILIAFMLLVVFAGRVAQVEADVRSAAQEAARAASLRASPAGAETAAQAVVDQNLSTTGLACGGVNLVVDTTDLRSGGQVGVTLRCTTSFSDLAVLGVPGSREFSATAVEVVDTYRGGA